MVPQYMWSSWKYFWWALLHNSCKQNFPAKTVDSGLDNVVALHIGKKSNCCLFKSSMPWVERRGMQWYWVIVVVNCPSIWFSYLSLDLCVDHHSNRETGTAMFYNCGVFRTALGERQNPIRTLHDTYWQLNGFILRTVISRVFAVWLTNI